MAKSKLDLVEEALWITLRRAPVYGNIRRDGNKFNLDIPSFGEFRFSVDPKTIDFKAINPDNLYQIITGIDPFSVYKKN